MDDAWVVVFKKRGRRSLTGGAPVQWPLGRRLSVFVSAALPRIVIIE